MSLRQDKHSEALSEQIADRAQAEGSTFSLKTVQNGGEAQRAQLLAVAPERRKITRPTHHQSLVPANPK